MSSVSYSELYDQESAVFSRILDGRKSLKRITILSNALEANIDKLIKSLNGIPKLMEGTGRLVDSGTAGDLIMAAANSSLELASCLQTFVTGLDLEVHSPLSDTKATLTKAGTKIRDRGTKINAEVAKARSAFKSAESRAQRAVEAQAIAQNTYQEAFNSGQLDPGKMAKLDKAARSAANAFTEADGAHERAANACAAREEESVTEVDLLLQEAATLDEERLRAIQSAIIAYASQIQNLGVAVSNVGANLLANGQAMSITGDMEAFLNTTRTGAPREAAAQYIRCTSGQEGAVAGHAGAAGAAGAAAGAGGETAVVKYNYEGEGNMCLSIEVGQVLTVLDKHSDEWTRVRNADGGEGLVPTSYIEFTAAPAAGKGRAAAAPAAAVAAAAAAVDDLPPPAGPLRVGSRTHMAYEFNDPSDPQMLQVDAGDVVEILEIHEGGWAKVRKVNGAEGLVPQEYLETV